MKCPGCQGYMDHIEYEGIAIESCGQCGGEWLDADEIKKITDIREQHFDVETRRAVAEAHGYDGTPGKHLDDRDIVCPKCGETTDPINYGGGSGLIVDQCTGCKGFWLDDGELEKVQMIVEGWDDALSGDLAKYSDTLHDIAVATDALDESGEQKSSRIPIIGPFINACVNGIIGIR